MNPNNFLNALERINKAIDEAQLANLNAYQIGEDARKIIANEHSKLLKEMDIYMETLRKNHAA